MDDQNPVLPGFPYKNRFTAEQLADVAARREKLVDIMMDPVGPNGTVMSLPVDLLHILAFHMACAGADTHTDGRRLIESRTVRPADAMFEVCEWRPVGDFDDEPAPDPVVEAREAADRLRPEVRAALATILTKEEGDR